MASKLSQVIGNCNSNEIVYVSQATITVDAIYRTVASVRQGEQMPPPPLDFGPEVIKG